MACVGETELEQPDEGAFLGASAREEEHARGVLLRRVGQHEAGVELLAELERELEPIASGQVEMVT